MSKKFEVGKTYYTRSICDNDCIITGKVLRRTAATVTMEVKGYGVKTLRISKGLSEHLGAEAVKPWGTYSMAPTLSADRIAA
jgi:hypothetical protein